MLTIVLLPTPAPLHALQDSKLSPISDATVPPPCSAAECRFYCVMTILDVLCKVMLLELIIGNTSWVG